MKKELAETGQLKYLLEKIGGSLDQFLRFEHSDAQSSDKNWKESLNKPVPQKGIGIDAVSKRLSEWVIPYGSPVPNPGFTSFITTGATTASALASAAANIASPQRYMMTAFNFIEELSLDWLAEMFSIPDFKGVYSSGGSVANLVALGGARQYAFEKIGIDPAAEGLTRAVGVYASVQCHHTIQRSCGVLGVGRRAVRPINCDADGRMLMSELKAAIASDKEKGILPMAIVANAGTTDIGAIDPLHEMAEIAKENEIWFHVDGAYGLPGILDERIKDRYKGLELADSIIVDPHKWLGASVGIATTFVKDREILFRAFTQEPANYLEGTVQQQAEPETKIQHSADDFGIPYFDYGVELSAPCRGVVVWAMLQEIGVEGMRARIKKHNDMAAHIYKLAGEHPQLEALNKPELSICCFRFVDKKIEDLDGFNQRLHRRLVRANEYMPSTTKVNGQLGIRPCYVGARHEFEQADGLLQAVLKIGNEMLAEI